MVRLFSTVLSALVLSGAVLAVPTMPYEPAPVAAMPEPAMAGSSSSTMMAEPTSKAMKEETSTSTKMMHETSTSTAMAHEATTTAPPMKHETMTSEAAAATTTAIKYGSGSYNWGTDLNSCVQMCQAKFGMSSGAPPPPAETQPTSTSPGGTGATHTVIVAPTKGVLRYVPFAVNASVGDTVRFMWGAGPHTVTKSSSLTVCNKSAEAGAFASGMQNASFIFDQVVNTTEPVFFYCAVATHCQKGMFGIVNPPSAPEGSTTSVGAMMSTWTSQNPDLAKMQTEVDKMTINTPAYNWASNLDSSKLPTEAHEQLVQNIFQTRMFYATNPGAEQGASRPDGQPLNIAPDVTSLLTATAGNPGGANGAPAGAAPSGTPTGTPAAVSSSPTPTANGAKGLAASSALIAGVAVLSSLFLF
ncbi:hypothetical protein FRC12_010883 [Ceratobasidium sp. 428]|nr:hypothetical protein FRC12_010883 [Ceratobasidium sp. 428]